MRLLFALILSLSILSANDADYYFNKMQERAKLIQDLKMEVGIKSRLPGLTVPDRSGTLWFKRPDKLHLDGKGFMMIPREALMMDFSAMKDSLTEMRLLSPDSLKNKPEIMIEFQRIEDNRIFFTHALIDTTNWTIKSIDINEGSHFRSTIYFYYIQVNEIFVPSFVRANIESSQLHHRVVNPRTKRRLKKDGNQSGFIELTFSKYQINKGIDDSIFIIE
ncbi:MAG: hypothetical protein KAI81_06800 [Candidatus Marinimicrobia bacterium]|nr:hypothetical protein [Candidatus Neomarinimicrobiota bacterium]